MNGWLDWRAIELQNDWGLREKSDAMGEVWNKGAEMWDTRWKHDLEFTARQAAAIDVLPGDTVLDVCCGTGPLTMHVAPRVKEVVAFDYGRDMLATLERNAAQRGLTNVRTLQGNWYSVEPGRELPVCDVAITRWSPAQGDILKFSRCARRRCYSLGSVTPDFAEGGFTQSGFWCRSTVDESLNTTPRPCGRKYGFNVHFNLLYDAGANPEVTYLVDTRTVTGASKSEVLEKVFGPIKGGKPDGAQGQGEGDEDADDAKVAHRPGSPRGSSPFDRDIVHNADGTWTFNYKHTMVVMSWDPNEVRL